MFDTLIDYAPDLQKALGETIMMVVITIVMAIVIGLPLGIVLYLTGRDGLKRNAVLYRALGTLVNGLRSFPFIILMVVLIPLTRLVVGTSIGPKAAAVSLSIAAIPFFARLVEQALREVPRGVIDAAQAAGATEFQIVREVLVPEAMPGLVSSITVTAISFIAYSAVAGAIGAGGIGDLAIRYGYYRFETGVMIWCVIIMYLLVQLVQSIGTWTATRIDRR